MITGLNERTSGPQIGKWDWERLTLPTEIRLNVFQSLLCGAGNRVESHSSTFSFFNMKTLFPSGPGAMLC